MPQLQTYLLPTYGPDGLSVIAVNVSRNTAYAAALALDEGLTLPMAFDMDSEVFRHYRIPGFAFPLNVVIDRSGDVIHVDHDTDLIATEAAIVGAL